MLHDRSSTPGDDSEDDFDWEEVDVAAPQAQEASASTEIAEYYADLHGPEQTEPAKPSIEVTIQTVGKRKGKEVDAKKLRAQQLHAERLVRVDCHKIHTVALLANAKTRNHWINDPLLHARLMSLTPFHLQTAFTSIHKSRVPDAAHRGRLFEAALTRLVEWWSDMYQVMPTGHLRSRPFEEVQAAIAAKVALAKARSSSSKKGKGKARADDSEDDSDEEGGERIKSEKSLMKHALMRRGSRDASAQLFTALCRALGIPARLVVSLQSVPWQANVGKPKPTTTAKKKRRSEKAKQAAGEDDEDDDMEEVDIPGDASTSRGRTPFRATDGPPDAKGKGKEKAPPVIKLRKSRGQKLGSAATAKAERSRPRERTPDPTTTPPVFWTEVFSRADARWIPVDPIRCIVNRRKAFDPTPNPNAAIKPDRHRLMRVENRLVYVLAFEEDGYARDVTPRYAREFGAKVAKAQQGGRGRREWWEQIVKMVARPFRLARDDLEDEELQANQLTEAMPTTMVGFKDHPLYVLARHLKRDEVVEPPTELGKFRGESVYPRSSVLSLKTAENWMRQGRKVREGCQPLKWVKHRAATVNGKRAIEMALSERKDKQSALPDAEGEGPAGEGAEDGVMQGMYAGHQTELYEPAPVVDGKIPKNDFGNIDLYVPSMLPRGAVHVPYKGTAKIARQLGFDFAEAVTGFEFKKRRAFPIVTGVVVAQENEEALLEAYWQAEHEAEEKRRAKREEQVIKRWTKLVQGLRIRQRLIEQYADRGADAAASTDKGGDVGVSDSAANGESEETPAQGGFLTGVNDVVQPYRLPRNLREIVEHAATNYATVGEGRAEAEGAAEPEVLMQDTLEVVDDDQDPDAMEDVIPAPVPEPAVITGAPKTMRELAEAAEAANRAASTGLTEEIEEELTIAPPVKPPAAAKATRAGGKAARTPNGKGKSSPRKRSRAQAAEVDAGSDEDAIIEQPVARTPKRAKRAAPTPAPSSDRVLRVRKGKTEEQIQEERKREVAYRRAVAE